MKKGIVTLILFFTLCVFLVSESQAAFLGTPPNFVDNGVTFLEANTFLTNNDNMDVTSEEIVRAYFDDFFGFAQPRGLNNFVFEKRFDSLDSLSFDLVGANSGGTTEYFFLEEIINNTSTAWNQYHIELGLRHVSGEVVAFQDSGLGGLFSGTDLDFGENDPFPSFFHVENGVNALVVDEIGKATMLEEERIWFEDILITPQPTGRYFLVYSMDFPDFPFDQLTPDQVALLQNYSGLAVIQTPSFVDPAVIPESSTVLMFGVGSVFFAFQTRKRRRTEV